MCAVKLPPGGNPLAVSKYIKPIKIAEAAGGIFEGMAGNSFGQEEEIKKNNMRFGVLSAVLLRTI